MTPAPAGRTAPDRSSSDTAALAPTTGPTAHPIVSDPVTVADIAEFTTRLARLRPPTLGGDPAERAELLRDKAELLGRIAEQHARTDPAYSRQIHRPGTDDVRTATDVNPTLTSPSATSPSATSPSATSPSATSPSATSPSATSPTGPVRCYYATDPAARPHCTLAAVVRYGRTALCGSCRHQRSTLGKGLKPTPIRATDPIDLLAWIAQARHDRDAAERVLHAAVTRARQHRHPWSVIGDTLHISRQGAQQRFRPRSATPEGRTP